MSHIATDDYLESKRKEYTIAMDEDSTPQAVSIIHELIVMGYSLEAGKLERDYKFFNK